MQKIKISGFSQVLVIATDAKFQATYTNVKTFVETAKKYHKYVFSISNSNVENQL